MAEHGHTMQVLGVRKNLVEAVTSMDSSHELLKRDYQLCRIAIKIFSMDVYHPCNKIKNLDDGLVEQQLQHEGGGQ